MTKNDEEREILKAEIIKLLRNASISDLRAVYIWLTTQQGTQQKKGTRIITIRVPFFLPRQARRYRFFQAPATRGRQAHSGAGRARRAARGCQACRS